MALDISSIHRYKPTMKYRFGYLCILLTILAGCTFPIVVVQPVNMTPSVTATTTLPPTPTSTATPLPQPTDRVSGADFALLSGNYDSAQSEYQLVLSQSADPEIAASAWLGLGRVYIQKQDYASALNAFNQIVTLYPQTSSLPNALFFTGMSYANLDDHEKAAGAYDTYLSLRPGLIDAFVYERKGDNLFQAADFAGAITAYQSALDASPTGDFDTLQLKIGRSYFSEKDNANAIQVFINLLNTSTSEYTKSTANLLAGQAYLEMNLPEQAYARFQDSVNNYPKPSDTYSALVQLVDASIPVDDYARGVVDYYAEQFFPAIDSLIRYINSNSIHAGSAHFYLGLSYIFTDQFDLGIQQYDELIRDHSDDRFWASAWDEKAWTLWYKLQKSNEGAQVYIDFVSRVPSAPEAPQYLFEAARIYERSNQLVEAASTWERLINEYPSNELSYRALFLAGIAYYRLAHFNDAMLVFQRCLVLANNVEDQAGADFWIGKSQVAKGDSGSALTSWENANTLDPTSYYGIRALERILNQSILQGSNTYDLGVDYSFERGEAEAWLRTKFNIPSDVLLSSLGEIATNPKLQRGDVFWQLGFYDLAKNEFETLRQEMISDVVNSYRLLNHFLDINNYYSAVYTSRQILDLAYLDDASTLQAPVFFNHVRFGPYFRSLVTSAAQNEGLNPLLLYALMRQESFFDPSIVSSSGAIGLMQIMPITGQETAGILGWPEGYTTEDLFNPLVNITFGAQYLARWRDYFDGDLYAAVASYNGGPGNVQDWLTLSGNDPDLFVEILRASETRTYVMQVVEFFNIYRMIYERR
jgi:soluble lytic murein transglycosylase